MSKRKEKDKMRANKTTLWILAGAVAALLLLIGVDDALAQKVSGAIFTTHADSSFVNANVYGNKEDVYLNGGPRPNAPCTAAGLPDGYYYFQVTDPSGAMLLSSDDVINRMVHVSGGVIVASGTTTTHLTPYPNSGKCVATISDNITVQLSPFDDTPNPGGEYKVWMTLVSDYNDFGGFVPSKSKTDNFKVSPPDDGDCEPNCPV
jgi:hypothetical protein